MSMRIVYCATCGFRISGQELSSGTAITVDENTTYCEKCAPYAPPAPAPGPAPVPARKHESRTNIIPVQPSGDSRISNSRLKPAARATARHLNASPSGRGDAGKAAPAPSAAGNKISPAVIVGGGVGAVVLGALVFLFMHGSAPPAEKAWGGPSADTQTASSQTPVRPSPEAEKPEVRKKVMPGLSMLEPFDPHAGDKSGARTSPEPAAIDASRPVAEPEKAAPLQGEIVWIDDELPRGSEPKGTGANTSWRWVPSPVLSGKLAHMTDMPEQHDSSQHYFEHAESTLKCGKNDMLFSYVFLDAKHPPKEIMLQFNYQNVWDHRVYWGEELLRYGPAKSKGALPESGKWVRLEVSAADIGITGDVQISGLSFDDFGGTVYWDKSGVLPGAGAASNVAAVQTPIPLPQAAPTGTLAKVMYNQMQGGQEYQNFFNKGKNSRACWGKRSPMPFLSGTFTLPAANYEATSVALVSLRHDWAQGPCHIAIKINNQEIFNGPDPATTWEWAEHRFPIPAGVLKGGANDFRIDNLEDTDAVNAVPWYMLHSVEVLSSQVPAVAGNSAAPSGTVAEPGSVAAPGDVPAAGISFAKLGLGQISGGTDHGNFGGKGKTGRAIWGKKNNNGSTASGSFDIRSGVGPGVLIVNNFPHQRAQPTCSISVEVNGKEIFKGNPPATAQGTWGEQRFDIPDGILKPGRNEFKITDTEPEGEPWYMIDTVEIVSARPLTPQERLGSTAPKKSLENDGALFSSEIALRLQGKLKGKAAKNTVLCIGPGFVAKEFDFAKVMGKQWAVKSGAKELSGPAAAPALILGLLPAELESLKPEVVVFVADANPARKISELERLDWEDVARLCMRMGAVPVLGIPASTNKDENGDLRTAMLRAISDNQFPSIQLKSNDYFPVQLKQMLGLIEKHVYCRESAEKDVKGKDIE